MNGQNPRDVLTSSELDRFMSILADRQRRAILYTLGQENPRHVSDLLVRGVKQPDHVEIELRHSHLPKLDDAGYIEWDRETDEVRPGVRYDDIEPLLSLIGEHTDEFPPDTS